MFTLSGCLVDDPPPYTEPRQTPPRLDHRNTLPLLAEVIVAKSGDTLRFKIPSSSEDAGEGLNAFLLLDYQGANAIVVAGTFLPPSTLEDTDRSAFEFDWKIERVDPGCHRLTLRVGHVSNLPNAYDPVVDPSHLAEAYWWMNLDVDPSLNNVLVDCPLASRGEQ